MAKLRAGRPSGGKSKSLTDLKNENKVRLNADIPNDLYKKTKIRAIEEGHTITDLVKLALNEYLSK